jgi:AcrR family transcriptional regulator
MQQIADAAGMTKGAPYYHFKNKEELFHDVSREILADLREVVTAAIEEERTFLQRLVRAMHDAVETMSGELSQWFIDFRQTLPPEEQLAIVSEAFGTADIGTVLDPMFERARLDGEMLRVDPAVASRVFMMLLLACVDKRQFRDIFKLDTGAMIDEAVDVFLHGVL